MINTLEKGFHALLLAMMFMLMMSLLKAQIPQEPSELVSEMESFVALLRNTGLVYGLTAIILFLLGILSPWWRDARFSIWLPKIGFIFNLAGFAVILYFIGWFWVTPC